MFSDCSSNQREEQLVTDLKDRASVTGAKTWLIHLEKGKIGSPHNQTEKHLL